MRWIINFRNTEIETIIAAVWSEEDDVTLLSIMQSIVGFLSIKVNLANLIAKICVNLVLGFYFAQGFGFVNNGLVDESTIDYDRLR